MVFCCVLVIVHITSLFLVQSISTAIIWLCNTVRILLRWYYEHFIHTHLKNKCCTTLRCSSCSRTIKFTLVVSISFKKKQWNTFFSTMKWYRLLKSILVEDNGPFILHIQWHSCWLTGDARGYGISSYSMDLVISKIPISTPGVLKMRYKYITLRYEH